tara:strand:+ start:814 stop:1470 length:657 start_codon:yes stop_codon:yes gene_type:complete
MNYSELVQAIKDYTENTETTFVSQIPTFVRQTEEKIHRSVLLPELRKNVTANTTANNRFLTRPSDFLAPFSIAVIDGSGDYTFMLPKDVNFIREAYPNKTTSGLPKFYAEFDGDIQADNSAGHFLLAPTPDSAYEVQLHYYFDPPSIVTSSTSWLGENAEEALLYGALVEAYIFMKGEQDVLSMYQQRYNDALKRVVVLGEGRLKRDDYRDGQTRIEI